MGHPLWRVSTGKDFVVPNVFSFLGSSRCCGSRIGPLPQGEGTAALRSRHGERSWNHSTPPRAAPLHKERGTTSPLSSATALIGITPRGCGISLSQGEKADVNW